eukprot:TRINITY_DN9092_c0_g1_i1.p1 TRINITY_DN9092_c0_g1~~TRINITY_DN9092_c0_g1_i1.p1  ORF type:complete len:248 (-),score=40.12 TRINITY_DN9092_c0_g1_i1:77-820(-)
MGDEKKRIFLFDVDGTLTKPRGKITPEMSAFLADLRTKHTIGFVGGSDLPKQKEQVADNIVDLFDYCFPQNGLSAYKNGKLVAEQSIKKHLGEDMIKRFVKWTLAYISNLDIPVMRGTFIEFRSSMFNVSPIGRNCSQEEREAFAAYDAEHKIREKMVTAMQKEFEGCGLAFSIGGQISVDIFPQGWNKSYCLQFLTEFDEIYFFGDKTAKGGNDHEIFVHERTIGATVTSPSDTLKQVTDIIASFK